VSNDPVLSATATREYDGGPITITFIYRGRPDPLTPYVDTFESDVDDPGYRPGGQRYRSASLVVPVNGLNPLGAYGLALQFTSVADIDAVMAHLADVRTCLTETFTIGHFTSHKDDVTIDGGHIICPGCGGKDTIIAHESGMRDVPLKVNGTGHIEPDDCPPPGFDRDHYRCQQCGSYVHVPDDLTIYRPA
jgi:hypothetical protein